MLVLATFRAGRRLLAALLLALPLLARANDPVLTLQATGAGGGTDITAFVDQVQIVRVSDNTVVSGAVANPSFESLAITNFQYNPTGAGWTFNSNSGLVNRSGANSFGVPAPLDGTQAGFLQTNAANGNNSGVLSQTLVGLPAGSYYVRLQAAQRNCCSGAPYTQGVRILIDGLEVGLTTPANDDAFHSYTGTTSFTVSPPATTGAQSPSFTSAFSFNPNGINGTSVARATALDAAGNQYVTGSFTGTIGLGSTTLTSAGGNDMFVAKRSAATGAWLWAVRAGGTGDDLGRGLAVDATGNALVTGSFAATASFATSPAATSLTSAGGADVFVAKFGAADGACAWAVRTGGTRGDVGYGLAVDATGNALVTGYFSATASFATSPAATSLASAGGGDVFVAKFAAASGACAWAVRAGSIDNDVGFGLAVDANGNALVTGSYQSTASFATSPAATSLVSAGGIDVFVAKFAAASGACAWAVSVGGTDDDGGYGLAVDANGNALVTGYYQSTASFATSPAATSLASAGGIDVFVAKFGAASGACAWAVSAGGTGSDMGNGLAVDVNGNALVTGYFAGTASFATSPAATSLTSAGAADVFVAKFGAADGACAWAVSAGGTGSDAGNGLAVDANGNALVTGSYQSTAVFGTTSLVGATNVNTGFIGWVGLLPTITSFSPTSGVTGATVTLTGTNLASASSVSFNGTAQTTFVSNSATQIVLNVPAGATTGTLTVTTPIGTSAASSQTFTVFPPPTITSFSPTSGVVGTTVTLTGTNLANASSVSFNGTAQTTITSNTATSLTVAVPAGATTGTLTVTTPIGTSVASAQTFTVFPPPTITSFSPTSGVAGTTVTLTGTNLTNASSVSFNGTAQTTFVSNSATQIVLNVPAGATTGPLTVTTPIGGTSAASAQTFTVLLTPLTSSFTPTSGPLGTIVTLTGANFTGLTSVLVGEVPAAFTVVNATTVTAVVPRGATNQKLRVSRVGAVANPGTDLSAVAFQVVRPSSSSILPGGASLTTNGTAPLSVGYFSAPAVTDVDGDGLLDLLVGNATGNVQRFEQITLNDGRFALVGSLTTNGSTSLDVGSFSAPAVTDVDGDGLLDLLVGSDSGTVQRFEQTAPNGSSFAPVGSLTTDGTVALDAGDYAAPVVSDVDGNGLLDLLVGAYDGTVQRFEQTAPNGGVFAPLGNVATAAGPALNVGGFAAPAVTDVDGDGLLDLLVGNAAGTVQRFEQAAASGPAFAPLGTLTTNGSAALGTGGFATPAVTDVDGDGRLDLLLGTTLGTVQRYEQAEPPTALALAPQAVAENEPSGTVVGTFSSTDATPGETFTYALVAGAGDADNTSFAIGTGPNAGKLLTAAVFDYETRSSYSIRVRTTDATGFAFEQTFTISIIDVAEPVIMALSTAAELPGQTVLLTGTDFAASSTVSFGGVAAASVSYLSPTALVAVVPVGATPGSSAVVVSTGGTSSVGGPAFEVLQVYRSSSASGCLATASVSITGSGGAGNWRYLRLAGPGGAVVAAIEDTYNLGLVSAGFTALGTATASPVRVDGGAGRRYLDRNFYLLATHKTFPGQTVRVRFFGLTSELNRLQAVDGNATLAGLKASQYSGTNENCDLTDDDRAGERRLLAAPATVVAGADWFTAEATVADHFSEFYLTGASSPLPVELTQFTATAAGPAAVRLAWATASEKNSLVFEVERSLNGQQFAPIGTVAAAGSSSAPRSYELLDAKLPAGAVLLYYRLKQVDLDGTFSYSPVRAVALAGAAAGLALYPNPARDGAATLTGAQPGAAVTVFDALGRCVAAATADATGTAALVLPAGLATGVYVVRVGAKALRLTVE